MTASLSRAAREDASQDAPLAARPLTSRVLPAVRSINDNRASELNWDALCEPAAPVETVAPREQPGPWRFPFRDAAYGLAGALAIVVAVICLMAR